MFLYFFCLNILLFQINVVPLQPKEHSASRNSGLGCPRLERIVSSGNPFFMYSGLSLCPPASCFPYKYFPLLHHMPYSAHSHPIYGALSDTPLSLQLATLPHSLSWEARQMTWHISSVFPHLPSKFRCPTIGYRTNATSHPPSFLFAPLPSAILSLLSH